MTIIKETSENHDFKSWLFCEILTFIHMFFIINNEGEGDIMNYSFIKNFYNPKDVEFVHVFFDNGDYIALNKSEIIDFQFEFYDKMVWFNDAIVPVVKKGFIKLKIAKYKSSRYDSEYMNTIDEYNKNRKKYIEELCCNDSGIINIRFFNTDNWHKSVSGQFIGTIDGEYLILSAVDIWPSVPFENEKFSINLHSLNKNTINKINLDFENCESFDIFKNEILELEINLDEQLYEHSGDYTRQMINGMIKVKFDSTITWRHISFLLDEKPVKVKDLKNRLLFNKKQSSHDICRLYIHYDYAGFCMQRIESIEVDGKWVGEDEDCEGEYVSGYCEQLEKGIIAIHFKKYL